jgi:hypothetical protein
MALAAILRFRSGAFLDADWQALVRHGEIRGSSRWRIGGRVAAAVGHSRWLPDKKAGPEGPVKEEMTVTGERFLSAAR